VRYYSLTLTDPNSGQVWQPTATTGAFQKTSSGASFTSYANGQTNPAALNIEFDIPVYPYATPQGKSIIRIWGVGLQMLGQASQLAGQNFVLAAGMKAGLPLANPAQAGIIAQGNVYQAFGNWQGVNQTLDLICNPGELSPAGGISFNWSPGQSLQTALSTALSVFKGYTPKFYISANLQPQNSTAQPANYPSLETFAGYLAGYTQPIGAQATGNASYLGVQMSVVGNTINVWDGTAPLSATVQLAFQDLIGQPTWIDAATVNFKTVLRYDIAVGAQIKFPAGIVAPYALTSANAAAPNAPSRSKSVFQGTFTVIEAHHFANFRQPDADSWNTTFSAVTNQNG